MDTSYENIKRKVVLSRAFAEFRIAISGPSDAVSQDILISSESKQKGFEQSLEYWTEFHDWLDSAHRQQDFENSLGVDQHESYITLKDFFTGTWHDDMNPEEVTRFYWIKDAVNEERQNDNNNMSYAEAVSILFKHEMDPSPIESSVYAVAWVIARRLEAVRQAAAQRIAYSCLSSCRLNSSISRETRENSYSGLVCKRPGDLQSTRTRLPFYLWDVASRRTVEVHKLSFRPLYMCISHTWGRWIIEGMARLYGVPWSIPLNSRIDVQSLPETLHAANFPVQFIWLDLVCIPQGHHDPSRQAEEIAKQSDIFANAIACVAWLNDVRSWDRLMPAITWLGLSYLQHHSGLHFPDVGNYLETLQNEADDGNDLFQKIVFPSHSAAGAQFRLNNTALGPTEEKIGFHAEYCCSRSITECLAGRRLCAASSSSGGIRDFADIFGFPDWISSLWTLQEACLFPNMSLAASDFTFLQTPRKLHITLDSLIALRDLVEAGTTRSAKQLLFCFPKQFGNSSPMDVMLMGNERQCSGQRAPAIMSVIGATEWYDAQIKAPGETPGEGDIVLGKYPLAFVREAAAKIGPLFHGTCPLDCIESSIGAMLPFFEGDDNSATFPFQYTYPRKDASHDAWQITSNGAVVIKSAVIIATGRSRRDYQHPPRPADPIWAGIYGVPSFSDGETDLQLLLDMLATKTGEAESFAFAVHLSQDTEKNMGIILASSISEELENTAILAKFGAYEIGHSEENTNQIIKHGTWPRVPEPERVDWVAI